MKRLLSAVACLALGIVLVIPSVAYADETSIYAPFGSFEELYNEYMDAMENGDVERQEWLLDIGESSLDAEIKLSEEALASVPAPMYNPDEMYWINQFPKYFHYGTWKYDSQGRPNLALWPINTGIWLPADTANGWNATYTKFRNDSQWRNENVASMKDCHARPIYSTVAGEYRTLETAYLPDYLQLRRYVCCHLQLLNLSGGCLWFGIGCINDCWFYRS